VALGTELKSVRMSKIENSGLNQYGAEASKQQQFGSAGVEGAKSLNTFDASKTEQRQRT